MVDANSPDHSDLLGTILEPLLDDFTYWFGRSRTLLETERLDFLPSSDQYNLLQRVCSAQDAVQTTRTLMNVTDRQVGIETDMLITWHRLVAECWQVARRYRQEQASPGPLSENN